MKMETVVYLLLLLAMLVIFLIVFKTPLEAGEKLAPEPAMRLAGRPVINILQQKSGEAYVYGITMNANLEYAGKLDKNIIVVAMMTFKGKDKKALAAGQTRFPITKDNPRFSGILEAAIVSNWAPIRQHPQYAASSSSFSGKMKAFESFVFSDKGKFLVSLASVDDSTADKLNSPLCFPWKSPACDVPCYADFKITCGDEFPEEFKLKDLDNCRGGPPERCERRAGMCGGEVSIKLTGKTSCDRQETEKVEISVKGGKEIYEPKEELFISFWQLGKGCVDNYKTFNDLKAFCGRDFLGAVEIETDLI